MVSSRDVAGVPPGPVERRRYPRHRAGIDVTLTMPTEVDAEVLDISAGGALVSTTAEVAPGYRGRFRALLYREPFSAAVEVLRVDEGTRSGRERRYHVGLRFSNLDETSRRTLQRFVKDDPKPR